MIVERSETDVKSSVARLSNEPKASETVNVRPSVARELILIIIVDGGGGKNCDEAEGEGAVDDGIVDIIDGGGIHSSSKICKILESIRAELGTN